MNEFNESLWICPICSLEHPTPVITCRRCECQLLLLAKIRLTAIQLNKNGFSSLAERFYFIKNEDSD